MAAVVDDGEVDIFTEKVINRHIHFFLFRTTDYFVHQQGRSQLNFALKELCDVLAILVKQFIDLCIFLLTSLLFGHLLIEILG